MLYQPFEIIYETLRIKLTLSALLKGLPATQEDNDNVVNLVLEYVGSTSRIKRG